MATTKPLIFGVVLFIIFMFTRVWHITSTPATLSHDELYYPLQAKTLLLNGRDLQGVWRPYYLYPANPLFAEWPGLLMLPATYFLSSNPMLAAKATHVFLGSLFPFIIGLFAYQLSGSKSVGWMTVLLTGVNPWFFANSRLAYDAFFSLFFYFVGAIILLKFNGKKILLSILPFTIGFFQYQGLKVIFVPMVVLLSIFKLCTIVQSTTKNAVFNWREHIYLIVLPFFSLLLMSAYIVVYTQSSDNDRISDLVFSSPVISSQVDLERKHTISTALTPFTMNKLTALISVVTKSYIASFDPIALFVSGSELRNPLSHWKYGVFHLSTLPLILLGFPYFLHKKRILSGALLLSLLAIAPIPEAINATGSWPMYRASMMVPIVLVFAAGGASMLFETLKPHISLVLFLILVLSTFKFFYTYFFSYPILSASNRYFSERLIASYVNRIDENNSIIVLTDEPDFVFQYILHEGNLINYETVSAIQSAFKNRKYHIKSIVVDNRCLSKEILEQYTTVIVDSRTGFCDQIQTNIDTATSIQVVSVSDSAKHFDIYGDVICQEYALNPYPVMSKNQFDLPNLELKQFCETFFVNQSLN